MPDTTIENKKMTITVQVMLAIIASTITIVFTVLSSVYELKGEMTGSIKNIENENKIQDLKYENLRIEVERTKLSLEKLKDEIKNDKR